MRYATCGHVAGNQRVELRQLASRFRTSAKPARGPIGPQITSRPAIDGPLLDRADQCDVGGTGLAAIPIERARSRAFLQ
jgi:hypothetical protein